MTVPDTEQRIASELGWKEALPSFLIAGSPTRGAPRCIWFVLSRRQAPASLTLRPARNAADPRICQRRAGS